MYTAKEFYIRSQVAKNDSFQELFEEMRPSAHIGLEFHVFSKILTQDELSLLKLLGFYYNLDNDTNTTKISWLLGERFLLPTF